MKITSKPVGSVCVDHTQRISDLLSQISGLQVSFSAVRLKFSVSPLTDENISLFPEERGQIVGGQSKAETTEAVSGGGRAAHEEGERPCQSSDHLHLR